MKDDRVSKFPLPRRNFAKFVIAGVVAASCAVTVFAFAAQMDSGRFDPSSFMGSSIGMQANPEFNAAYDVADQSQSGQANMNKNQGDQDSQQPSLDQVQAADFQQDDASGSGALRVTDGDADMSIITNGGGGSASNNGGIAGPVIDGDGTGGGGAGGDEGGGGGGATSPDSPEGIPNAGDTPTFSDDKIPDDGGTKPSVTLDLFNDTVGGDTTYSITPLYSGEALKGNSGEEDGYRLICGAFMYVYFSGDDNRYRLSRFDDHFRVMNYTYDTGESGVGYPSSLNENSDTITMEFGFWLDPSSATPDATGSLTFDIYDYRIMALMDEQTGQYTDAPAASMFGTTPGFFNEGDTVDLTSLSEQKKPVMDEATGAIVSLFTGWIDDNGSESFFSTYTPSKQGLTLLSPAPYNVIPDGYVLKMVYDSFYEKDWVTLVACPDVEDIVIPDGTQNIFGWLPEPGSVKTLTIPASLQGLSNDWDTLCAVENAVSDEYIVKAGNTSYSVENHLLINEYLDEWGFEPTTYRDVVGIPTALQEITIPQSINGTVTFPTQNALDKIIFEGSACESEYLDISVLQAGTTIVVPTSSFTTCSSQWSAEIACGAIILESSDPTDPDEPDATTYFELSADKTTLLSVKAEATGAISVPYGVTTVATGAFDACPNVTKVTFPSTLTTLQDDSLSGFAGSDVVFQGTTPPDLGDGAAAFGDPMSLSLGMAEWTATVTVADTALTDYQNAWDLALSDIFPMADSTLLNLVGGDTNLAARSGQDEQSLQPSALRDDDSSFPDRIAQDEPAATPDSSLIISDEPAATDEPFDDRGVIPSRETQGISERESDDDGGGGADRSTSLVD